MRKGIGEKMTIVLRTKVVREGALCGKRLRAESRQCHDPETFGNSKEPVWWERKELRASCRRWNPGGKRTGSSASHQGMEWQSESGVKGLGAKADRERAPVKGTVLTSIYRALKLAKLVIIQSLFKLFSFSLSILGLVSHGLSWPVKFLIL